MGGLLVKAISEEEREIIIDRMAAIVGCTGGWMGRLDDEDDLGELEVRLIVPRASDEELQQVWVRVAAGETAEVALRAVNGPYFQYLEAWRTEHERLFRNVRREELSDAQLNRLRREVGRRAEAAVQERCPPVE